LFQAFYVNKPLWNSIVLLALLHTARNDGYAAAPLVAVGEGSYTIELPAGAQAPPRPLSAPPQAIGRIPTSDWWSSLFWSTNSFALYPHPLAVRCEAAGLRVAYPGPDITANQHAIFGAMPARADDLVIGHSRQQNFPKANVEQFSDWFVRLVFATNGHSLRLSFGHGSPFVYGLVEGGGALIRFSKPPAVWDGSSGSALGITINGRHYGLFAPSGSKWTGANTSALTCDSAGKMYFSVAILPDNSRETLALFARFAHSHVIDTRVEWNFDQATSSVRTKFSFTTTNHEGNETGTLFALYPHQWRNTSARLLPRFYDSVRGKMKLGQGSSFTTTMSFFGVLPALPKAATETGRWEMSELVAEELKPAPAGARDTYWEGKRLGKTANVVPIAEQYGLASGSLVALLRNRLEGWFTAGDSRGGAKKSGLFYYDTHWGTLIGFPASYGSNNELNDHHFHYGYFIRAAAEVAAHDPEWATKYGGMVKLLIRDIASGDHADAQFPFLRCFDPYAGHSWASGHAKFADGNNQESSSEAMNAWYGMILWGEATGDRVMRDLGIYLFTTEMHAIQEYWFNVHGDNFPPSYPPAIVTMVWGGKGANGTWFTADPQLVHAINWLPIHGGSLYLGLYPDFVEKNYRALVTEHHGDHWNNWSDIIWMYRALNNPPDAIHMLEAAGRQFKTEDGNSRANTVHWIYNLAALGQVDRTVTADSPLYAVFRKGDKRTYTAYNMSAQPRTVTFSDGVKIQAHHGFTVSSSNKDLPAR